MSDGFYEWVSGTSVDRVLGSSSNFTKDVLDFLLQCTLCVSPLDFREESLTTLRLFALKDMFTFPQA